MPPTDPRDVVLFLCVANSARSQMAEGLARAMAPAGVEVHSAGSEPARMHPMAARALRDAGLDPSAQRSKGLDEVPQERVRIVVTLCADEVCPAFFPGEDAAPVIRLHWPQEDPAAASGGEEAVLAAFVRVRDRIRARLEAFFADPALFPPGAQNSSS